MKDCLSPKEEASLKVKRWPKNTIAAGRRHTVGLKSDGTLVAAGNNESGQCNVNDWSEMAAVAAGCAHTLGLKSDGTVAAAGDNEFGQCDVRGWRGIRLPGN
ncbi:chromosome condensation regulator [Cohnella algarum]|nr:chromosome condensation regulator [Cohnella algarum]